MKGEIVRTKMCSLPISAWQQMLRLKSPIQQAAAGFRGFGIAAVPPGLHLLAQFRHQGRRQFFKARCPERLVRRKPTDGWV